MKKLENQHESTQSLGISRGSGKLSEDDAINYENDIEFQFRSGPTSFHYSEVKLQNLLLLWGCQPGSFVKRNTKMISEIINRFFSDLDPIDLSI